MSTLTYDWVSDETAEVFIDDTFVGTLDHGAHGWDGMTGMQQILNSVAKLKGWTISEKGDPAI